MGLPPHNDPTTQQPYKFGFLTQPVNINFPSGYFLVLEMQTSAFSANTALGSYSMPPVQCTVPSFDLQIPSNSTVELNEKADETRNDTSNTLWNIWPSDSVSPYNESLATYSSLGIPPFTQQVITVDTRAEAQAIIDSLGPFPTHPYLPEPATNAGETVEDAQVFAVLLNPSIDPATGAHTKAKVTLNLSGFSVPPIASADGISGSSSSFGLSEVNVVAAVFYAPQKQIVKPPDNRIGVEGPPWPIAWQPGQGAGKDVNTTLLVQASYSQHTEYSMPSITVTITLDKLSETDPTQVSLVVDGPTLPVNSP